MDLQIELALFLAFYLCSAVSLYLLIQFIRILIKASKTGKKLMDSKSDSECN